jgi:hypothetical protein
MTSGVADAMFASRVDTWELSPGRMHGLIRTSFPL